jgi:ATP-binding cassette subfamily B protein
MLFADLRAILQQMKQDPTIAPELPIVKRAIIRTFSWEVLSEILQVLQSLPVMFFTNELVHPGPSSPRNIVLIALSFAVLYKINQLISNRMGLHRNDVFWGCWRIWWGYGNRLLLRQSTDWHTQHSTGEKDSLIGKNVTRFQELFDEALFNTIPVLLRVGFTTIFMFFIGWQFGVVALVTMIAYAIVLRRSERRMRPHREEFQTRMKAVEDNGSELTKNWRTIRTLGLEERFSDHNEAMLRDFWHDEYPRHKAWTKCISRQDDVLLVSRAVLYLTLGLVALYSGNSATALGSLVLATTWMERAYSNYWRLSDFQRLLGRGQEALRELVAFMGTPPTVVNSTSLQWPAKATGKVMFNDVTFAYGEECHQPTIAGFNLEVPAYTSLAFVGESGSGKSTLMALLAREYDPHRGHIAVDDVNLRDIDYGRYRNQMIAVVSQSIELFDRSIADNIRLARPNASMKQIVAAAKAAGAHEFIVSTEQGYHTRIGENGLRLSGGQRQRLAIARALIMKPAILILDEATSALDAMSQAEVQQTIDELIAARVCTVFIIAHRLSTVRSADQIVVMDNGQLAARGTHGDLLATSTIYQKMNKLEVGPIKLHLVG